MYWISVRQRLTSSDICRSVTYILWSSDFAPYLEEYLMEKCCMWDNVSVWQRLTFLNICGSVTYISWAIDFAFYHRYRLKLFVYIKKWRRPVVLVPLQALALVKLAISKISRLAKFLKQCRPVWVLPGHKPRRQIYLRRGTYSICWTI